MTAPKVTPLVPLSRPEPALDDSGSPAGAPRPVLEASGVDKVYANGTVALKNADLVVREGEFVSLLGPSGCGKSTLLRILAGLGEVTTGTVSWWEQGYDVVGSKRRKLAFVFQNATLMPWARVRKNVHLPLDLEHAGNSAELEKRVDDAINLVGLKGFDQAFPRELSGGMQMRASIARALVTEPNLLLMDEPFGALDEMTRNKLNDDVLKLWRDKGWTVVFVTHSVYEAVYLSSRVVVMAARPGRIVDDIAIDEPYPRSTDFRVSTEFAGYCRQVSQALERASAMGDDPNSKQENAR
ncbi:ABC transporter ATP-binding protein [Hydrocarboniclastica marina]|uniref:ABC transporter ATP-binding protein n=1 Tax=Hydrocarboniclastica marina TaxID=2259620 RepID=A0A4P7XJZ8_9ALTE|nr:ABC transporter ATP-binding protein [Hydrocarboniclastica marina]MAM00121.1 nitrate/sulfonate/bicarbonate ABC transporter ATP-binding protein [Alteromonadaceae bacterium]QCF27431.1 ABC transporter ATP-binding protein [Hydrocarboniclastica marina]|tara:strand:- start:777 stop:1667 length:891 start_codon:yes stop_codon:yes gene_type:complete